MATLRNAWQGIGNIGNPATTIAAETALTAQLANARQEGNKNIADLFTGLGKSDADRIVAESEQLFNTGNPLLDNKARTAYAAEQVGLQSPQQLSTRFNTQLANDQQALSTELGNKDLLETSRKRAAKQESLKALAGLRPGTPEYKQALEEQKQSGIINDFPTSQLDTLYSQELGGAQYEVMEETIQNAIGLGVDPTNPDSFTTNAYNTAIKTISDKIEKQWPGIQDKSKFDDRAKDILDKSKYGQNFSRRMTVEKGQTTQGIRLNDFASQIVSARTAGNQNLVDQKVNETLNFMASNNVSKEDSARFNKDVELALDRTNVNVSGTFQQLFNENYEQSDYVTPSQAMGLKTQLREEYRKKYPNLPDRLLDPQIAKVIKNTKGLGHAIQQGSLLVQHDSDLKADLLEKSRDFKKYQTNAVFGIRQTGLEPYIRDRIVEKFSKLKLKSGDPISTNDINTIAEGSSQLVQKFKNLFTKEVNGESVFLPGQNPDAQAAFWLTVNRAIVGNVGLDEDKYSPNDLILNTKNRFADANSYNEYQMLKLFTDSVPNASASISQNSEYNKDPRNIVNGLDILTQAVTKRNAEAKAADNDNAIKTTTDWIKYFLLPEMTKSGDLPPAE